MGEASGYPGEAALRRPRAGLKGITANFSWQFAGEGAGKALAFLSALYMARVLGVEGFGKFSYAWVILTYGMVMADAGLGSFGTREVARDRGTLWKMAANITAVRVLISVALAAGVFEAGRRFPGSVRDGTLLLFTFVWLVPSSLNVDWAFRGVEKMEYSASWNAVHQAVFITLMLLFVKGGGDLLAVPLCKAAGALVASLALWAALAGRYPSGGRGGPAGAVDPRLWPGFLKSSIPMGGSYAMMLVVMNMGTVMLGIFGTPREVGWYAAGYNVFVQVTVMGSYLIASSFYPRLSYFRGNDPASFHGLFRAMTAAMSGIGLLLSIGVFAASGTLVPLLLGGSYHNTIAPLRMLSPSVFLGFVAAGFGSAFNAAGRERASFLVVAAGAAVSVLLNLALVPRYSMAGAAAATDIAYAVIVALYLAALRKALLRAG